MFAALAFAAALVTAPAGQPQEALEAYRACVLAKALAFRKAELSGDEPIIVIYAASYSCRKERYTLVEATVGFVKSRHPDLAEGGVGKVAAMFLEQQDAQLETQVTAALRAGR